MSKAFASIVSNVNIGKVTSNTAGLLSKTTKKFDVSSLSKASGKLSKLNVPTNIVSKNSSPALKAGKKTSKQLASEVGQFASHPGARKQLSKVTSAMASNPKIAATGITATAAAGFVAYRMTEGATFEEAMGELAGAATGVVVSSASAVTKGVAGVAGEVGDKVLTQLLGEDYMRYVYGVGVVVALLLILKLKRLLGLVTG